MIRHICLKGISPTFFLFTLLRMCSPLAGGMLSGKYVGGKRPEKARLTLFARFQDRYFTPAVHTAVDKYVAIAEKAGRVAGRVGCGS